ncbi:MAG: hypothetical protein RRZ68_05905 [Oscillospiraceae bacterium]
MKKITFKILIVSAIICLISSLASMGFGLALGTQALKGVLNTTQMLSSYSMTGFFISAIIALVTMIVSGVIIITFLIKRLISRRKTK